MALAPSSQPRMISYATYGIDTPGFENDYISPSERHRIVVCAVGGHIELSLHDSRMARLTVEQADELVNAISEAALVAMESRVRPPAVDVPAALAAHTAHALDILAGQS